MHPDGCGAAFASTTAVGSPPPGRAGATIVLAACTPGIEISDIPTCAPRSVSGGETRPVTVIRSQLAAPLGTRSRCAELRAATWSVTEPAAVESLTWETGGQSA